jgi:peptidoglycan/LPS O-acetylase OafA/YrhL
MSHESTPPERYHALDSLRGFAMLLGVLLHAAVAHMDPAPPFWPVLDPDTGLAATAFVLAVHDFRMQLFFLLAGFFGGLLRYRYGLRGLLGHRFRRIAIPFALALVFIVPSLQAVSLYAVARAVRAGKPTTEKLHEFVAGQLAAHPDWSDAELVARFFTGGKFVESFLPMHLWFLYYLLIVYAAVAVLDAPARRLMAARAGATVNAAFRWLAVGRWRMIGLVLLTLPALYTMKLWTVDTPLGWVPLWNLLLYYGGFFLFGWLLYRHRDLVEDFGRGWGTNLLVGNLLVLPVMLKLVAEGMEVEVKRGPRPEHYEWVKLAALTAAAAYTWLMITGLWGAFRHWFRRERPWVRYLADSSYWCYVASLTPLIPIQLWLSRTPLPGAVKFVLANAAVMTVLLASYHLFVRYTWVGALLHGRKRKPPG